MKCQAFKRSSNSSCAKRIARIGRLNPRITYFGPIQRPSMLISRVVGDVAVSRIRKLRVSIIRREFTVVALSSYSGRIRATVQTRGENGCTNVRELTMYGVCALSETQIAMRTQRQSSEIRSTCGRVKPVRAFHVCCSSTRARAPVTQSAELKLEGCANLIGY